jgi:hypothetical protein
MKIQIAIIQKKKASIVHKTSPKLQSIYRLHLPNGVRDRTRSSVVALRDVIVTVVPVDEAPHRPMGMNRMSGPVRGRPCLVPLGINRLG